MKKKFAVVLLHRQFGILKVLECRENSTMFMPPLLVTSEKEAKKIIKQRQHPSWELFGLIDDPTPYFEVEDEK